MAPYIRGAEAPKRRRSLIKGLYDSFFNDLSQTSTRNNYSNSCSGYYIELTAIKEKTLDAE